MRYELADCEWAAMQLVRGQFEAEMPRGGFECAERVEWWKGVGHRAAV
jgi:hypothetical protein